MLTSNHSSAASYDVKTWIGRPLVSANACATSADESSFRSVTIAPFAGVKFGQKRCTTQKIAMTVFVFCGCVAPRRSRMKQNPRNLNWPSEYPDLWRQT